jgi:glycosyltransferase involved in cell wall biosynthesis
MMPGDQSKREWQLTCSQSPSIGWPMRIAFYAPLKSPDHPIPSGDRLMARLLIAALRHAGYDVEIVSQLRSYAGASIPGAHDEAMRAASAEIVRISREWSNRTPELWFSYHPYAKAPDLIGPALSRQFGLAYVTAEASYSLRRNVGAWADSQALVADAVRQAAVNICLRQKDRAGLLTIAPDGRFEMLEPFIDASAYRDTKPSLDSRRIVTVAMMRPGDKLESYRLLARSLEKIEHLKWTIAIAGDGPGRPEVMAQFSRLDPARLEWLGERQAAEMPSIYSRGAIYAWPGCGEAYGLAYLEAQAAGLPVVAQDIDGVPGVVRNGETGMLTPAGDTSALADAIAGLLGDASLRQSMSQAARRFVFDERSFEVASARLASILETVRAGPRNG